MANLEIRKFKAPILRKRAEEVEEITPEIQELVFGMAEVMRENKGIGLAAPQVGALKKIIVVQTDLRSSKIVALVNPKIIRKSREKEKGEEGCLSFPNLFLEIKRAKEIEVEALNLNEKPIRIKASGFLARALQHEIDHLDGILFFNRLGFFQRIKFWFKYR